MDYRKMTLEGWKLAGEGGNGRTYSNDSLPDRLLKINNGKLGQLSFVKAEFDREKAVERLGIHTPSVYEIVNVGKSYGTIFQKIGGKKSFSRICADEPSRIPEMAALLASKGKELHATPCDTATFPSRRQQAVRGAKTFPFLNRKERAALLSFIDTIPESSGCLHGDFQYGNILSAEGELWWIDTGRFAYGDPMFDIGHFYMLTDQSRLKIIQKITHLTEARAREFWDCFVKAYTGHTDSASVEEFTLEAKRYMAMDIITRYVCQPSKIIALLQLGTIKRIISGCLCLNLH